jgi:Raf kinase inhibitor-like YbhB/YbcL family protein
MTDVRSSIARVFLAPCLAAALAACTGPAATPSATPIATPAVALSPTPTPSEAASAAAPSPPASASPAAATPTPTEEATMPPFTLSSSSIPDGGAIPRRFTCDGENVSPDLEWDGVPAGTAALVIVVSDPDARGFVHWLVVDMEGSLSGALPVGVSTSPDAPRQGINDFGRLGWGGPCPPSGEHRYVFTLYALPARLGLTGTPRASAVQAALGRATVLGTAVLRARYRRGG